MNFKSVAIIGCGLTGLRAGLELTHETNFKVSFFEKSPSVGGRIATRRYSDTFVNHGADKIDNWNLILTQDPRASEFSDCLIDSKAFLGRATDLPKSMKEKMPMAQFHFNQKMTQIPKDFDFVLITCPIPQAEELLGVKLNLNVSYQKEIFVIGPNTKIPLDPNHFDLPDEAILKAFQNKLEVKRWRYSKILSGVPNSFIEYSDNIILAGDAFDSNLYFDASSAWISGLNAAHEIIKKANR